ncbi:hypothetical protein ACIPUB_00785 [Paeniglutamicibacter sp. ORCA_105]|uniref:hypothetical protein n=1 Tax=Paeniglutamicibacter sp. ORCA_105 TaxID=3377336 RepID=UPI00389389A5
MSRRQFGLLLGWGAVLVAAPGVYGIVAKSSASLATRVSTAFGSIAVVRSGRLARLDGLGKPAYSGLAAAVSIIEHGGGVLPVKMAQAAGGGHGHGGGSAVPSLPGSTEPMNLTWPDVVVLEVNIRNDGQEPVLFSPGQLRLRLAGTETTITPQDSDHTTGTVAVGASESIYVSYLAPRTGVGLQLEFNDVQRDERLALDLPVMMIGGAT